MSWNMNIPLLLICRAAPWCWSTPPWWPWWSPHSSSHRHCLGWYWTRPGPGHWYSSYTHSHCTGRSSLLQEEHLLQCEGSVQSICKMGEWLLLTINRTRGSLYINHEAPLVHGGLAGQLVHGLAGVVGCVLAGHSQHRAGVEGKRSPLRSFHNLRRWCKLDNKAELMHLNEVWRLPLLLM